MYGQPKIKKWPNDEDWYLTATQIVDTIIAEKRGRTHPHENATLFDLRNDRVPEWWPGREENKSCPSCQGRVWKCISAKVAYYKSQKQEDSE